MTLSLTVADSGMRTDSFLAKTIPELSRAAAQRILEQGGVTRAGQFLKKNDRLTPGDLLLVTLPDPTPTEVLPQNIPLDIAFEDADVIVINKPVGMVVHPAPGHPNGTLVNALLYHCGSSLSGIGGVLRPGIVHRIDRDTSGLIIVAKNDAAHLALTAQLQDHSLFREYEAVVVGHMRENSGIIVAPIGRHSKDRKKMAIDPGGRAAITHWSLVRSYPAYTHVRCRLETGRTHQIRVHFQSLGHPLLGDPVYGKPYPGLVGQCLHAKKLCFRHPKNGNLITVECPLPEYFSAILTKGGHFL
ncbi:MAG: RluA family pseudouridine synthase [Evtepia sp.]